MYHIMQLLLNLLFSQFGYDLPWQPTYPLPPIRHPNDNVILFIIIDNILYLYTESNNLY